MRPRRLLSSILIVTVDLVVALQPEPQSVTGRTCSSGRTGLVPGAGYVLVWEDEFEVDGPVCEENWFHQTQIPTPIGWYNNEEQHYTNRIENSFVQDGVLNIVAKKEMYLDQALRLHYTSARLNSKFSFTYGRVDVRAKFNGGSGTWPAIWMLGQNVDEVGGFWYPETNIQSQTVRWPACGEIDIMEHFGRDDGLIHGSIHTLSSYGNTINTKNTTVNGYNTDFHKYSILWEETRVVFLVDDRVFDVYHPDVRNNKTWPFDKPQYLILNFAMGGAGGQIPKSFREASMQIDYVRVYQREPKAITDDDTPSRDDDDDMIKSSRSADSIVPGVWTWTSTLLGAAFGAFLMGL